MLKYYVEFDLPGVFMPETEVRQVKTRIPSRLRKVPKYTYAIQYFDREEVTKDRELLTGNAKNRSRRIVFGKVFTKSELPSQGFDEKSILYRNADSRSNGYKVIKCITGNWQPWDKDWIILPDYTGLRNLTNPI